MKELNKNNLISIVLFLIVFLFVVSCIKNSIVFSSEIIYANKETTVNGFNQLDTNKETFAPVAESTPNPNSVDIYYNDRKLRNKIYDVYIPDYNAFYELSTTSIANIAKDKELNENPTEKITYIRYSPSITNVYGNYKFLFDEQKKKYRLFIDDSPYLLTYAKSGFFKIDDKVYYFDDDEYMVTGKAKDDRNHTYIFDENGVMIDKITNK